MKTIFCGIFCCLLSLLTAKETELKTKIESVTVFQNGAQVKRKGGMPLLPGNYDLVVRNISPLLKKESIEVKGEGDLAILSVNHQVKYNYQETPAAEIALLEKKQKELENKIEDLNTKLEILNSEEEMINSLKNVTNSKNDMIVELTLKARNAAHTALSEIKTEQLNYSRQVKILQEELTQVSQELAGKRIPKTNVNYEIVVKVKVNKETKADFSVSYIVTNARWYPAYDVRVKSVSEPLRLEYKANISQQTGEDWNDAKLTLSTTDPSLSGQKPKIQKWTLMLNQNTQSAVNNSAGNYQRYSGQYYTKVQGRITDQYGEALAFATVMVPGSTVGTTSDMEGNFSLTLPPGSTQLQASYIGYKQVTLQINAENMNIVMEENATALEEVQIISERKVQNMSSVSMSTITREDIQLAGVVRGGRMNKKYSATISNAIPAPPVLNRVEADFEISERYDIPSDMKVYTISIKEMDVPSNYQYYCAPRLDKDVFLTAKITSWEQYNLLEGQANIYYEGTFVGNSLLNTRYVSDTLDISLGRDKNILVERKKSKEYSRHKLLGGDEYAYRKYDISVKNNKQQQVDLVIEDQFPVSGDSRIEVKKENNEGTTDESTGIVTWNMQLDKNGAKKLDLQYSIKYPKGNFVVLD